MSTREPPADSFHRHSIYDATLVNPGKRLSRQLISFFHPNSAHRFVHASLYWLALFCHYYATQLNNRIEKKK